MEVLKEILNRVSASWSDLMQSQTLLVGFATVIGLVVLLFVAIYATIGLVRILILYVFCQHCYKTNLVTKYGRWAVISGATDGIGKSMAKELAARGMSIIVIGRDEQKLEDTKRELQQVPGAGQVETVKIDLSDSSVENYAKIRAQIDSDNREIGILINNAGCASNKTARFNRCDMDEIVKMVNVNILATLHLTRMIMPGMIERGKGLVVNISSGYGLAPTPYMSVYGNTKTFVNHFTRQLQAEYESHPVEIVLVEPGPVYTGMLKDVTKLNGSDFRVVPVDKFARTTINAMTVGRPSFAGNLMHELMNSSLRLLHLIGMSSISLKVFVSMAARDLQLSPVPKRKKRNVIGNSQPQDGSKSETIQMNS